MSRALIMASFAGGYRARVIGVRGAHLANVAAEQLMTWIHPLIPAECGHFCACDGQRLPR